MSFEVTLPWEVEEGVEVELTVTGRTAPYYPATGPSWGDPGSPAEGGEVEDVTAITNALGTPLPAAIVGRLTGDHHFMDAIAERVWRGR